jgi:putative ABC transport system ATP-binding protein
VLRLVKVSKTYHTKFVQTAALSDISLDLREGEFVSITGPSGSGKSTLLNLLGLLEDFDHGQYELLGSDVTHLGDRARAWLRNRHFGFVFQAFQLIGSLTAVENVELPLRYRRMSQSQRRTAAMAALEKVGLTARSAHYPGQMSGGQQQRVALARALVVEPKLLLADEPTGNLDRQMSQGVLELMKQINATGTAILLITHDSELASSAHRCVRLVDGRVAVDA